MYYEYSVSNERVKNLFYQIYAWMTAALLLTAATAYVIASQPRLMVTLWTNHWFSLALIAAQLLVVIVFSARLRSLSYTGALTLFLSYALLSGITLSGIAIRYSMVSLMRTLIITGGMFASAAVYGYFTNTDLSKMRSILVMALIGFLIALIVNIFLRSSAFDFIIAVAGIIIFSFLTAADVNVLRSYALRMEHEGSQEYYKAGLLGALQLYLDFVNLFLSLLRLTGDRRK